MRTETFRGKPIRIVETDGQDWYVATDIYKLLCPSSPGARGYYYGLLAPDHICDSPMPIGKGRLPKLLTKTGASTFAQLTTSHLRDAISYWVETGIEPPEPKPEPSADQLLRENWTGYCWRSVDEDMRNRINAYLGE